MVMIDWAFILCSTAGYQMTTVTFIPRLLHTFLVLIVTCPERDFRLSDTCYQGQPYREGFFLYVPAPIGVEVRGVNLSHVFPDKVIDQLRRDVHKYRILIFKDQGTISGERHVAISRLFGELDSPFKVHDASPHPQVFRVSNDQRHGSTGVGIAGWHIDGSFREKPYSHALYHIVSVPKIGPTEFVGLKELIDSLSTRKRSLWERLWKNDNRTPLRHPLVYAHPVTSYKALCFHNGATEGFTWDMNTASERVTSDKETQEIIQDIQEEIVKDNKRLVYSHHWAAGDFIITDNLAVGHQATEHSQYSVDKVGLRVLHRTTVAGTWIPQKNFDDYAKQIVQ